MSSSSSFLLDEEFTFLNARRLDYIHPVLPANVPLDMTLTNLIPSPSMRPTEGNLTYNLTTWEGYPLEYSSTSLSFENLYPARISAENATVLPNLWDKGAIANYTLTFEPVGYEINGYLEVFVNEKI